MCLCSETHDAPPLLRRLRVELGRLPFALPPHPCPTLFACPPSRLLSSSARLCITTAPSHTHSCPSSHLLQLALQIHIHPPPYTTMYCPPCVSYLVSRPVCPPAPLRRGLYLRPSRSLFGDPRRDGFRLALNVNSSPRPRVVASRPSRHNCIDPSHISCMSISEPSFWLAIYNRRQ